HTGSPRDSARPAFRLFPPYLDSYPRPEEQSLCSRRSLEVSFVAPLATPVAAPLPALLRALLPAPLRAPLRALLPARLRAQPQVAAAVQVDRAKRQATGGIHPSLQKLGGRSSHR